MNKTVILIALIVWFAFTMALVCSVIGMLLFVRSDYNTKNWQGDDGGSTWAKIGIALANKLIE